LGRGANCHRRDENGHEDVSHDADYAPTQCPVCCGRRYKGRT
jgi:hypothetical protein